MRFVVLALLLSASLGCKDKPSDSAGSGAGSAGTGARVATPKGFVPVKRLAAKVNYAPDVISVNDEPVVTIAADGIVTGPQFASLRERLAQRVQGTDPVGVVIDSALNFGQIGLLLAALKQGGYRNLALMSGSGMAMVPVELAETDQLSSGLRPAVVVDSNGVLTLFSLSGLEGTKAQPKLTFNASARSSLDELTTALAEIVHRRWPNGGRPAEDRVIVIVLDPTQVADRLLSVLAAVRSDGKTELFPSIFLAGGV